MGAGGEETEGEGETVRSIAVGGWLGGVEENVSSVRHTGRDAAAAFG